MSIVIIGNGTTCFRVYRIKAVNDLYLSRVQIIKISQKAYRARRQYLLIDMVIFVPKLMSALDHELDTELCVAWLYYNVHLKGMDAKYGALFLFQWKAIFVGRCQKISLIYD